MQTRRFELHESEVVFYGQEPSERGESLRGIVRCAVRLVPRYLVVFDHSPRDGDLIQFCANVELGKFSGAAGDECELARLEGWFDGLRQLRRRNTDTIRFAGLEGGVRFDFTRTSPTSDEIRVTGAIDESREPFPATLSFQFAMTDARLDDSLPAIDASWRRIKEAADGVGR